MFAVNVIDRQNLDIPGVLLFLYDRHPASFPLFFPSPNQLDSRQTRFTMLRKLDVS